MTDEQQNVRRGACEQMPPSPPGSRHGWYYAECPMHGRTEHLTYLGGQCAKCQDEALVKAAGQAMCEQAVCPECGKPVDEPGVPMMRRVPSPERLVLCQVCLEWQDPEAAGQTS